MTKEELQNLISSWTPDPIACELQFTEEGSQFLNIMVPPEQLHQLMKQLRHHKETNFDYLFLPKWSGLGRRIRSCIPFRIYNLPT